MRYTLILLLAISLLIVSSIVDPDPAAAQAVRNQAERVQDRQQLRQDKQATLDDTGDLALLERLLNRFDTASEKQDQAALKTIDATLLAALEQELHESQHEVQLAEKEVRQGKREIRSDRREQRKNRKKGASRRVKADDRRDLRDDKRDLRDDERDLDREQARRETVQEIERSYSKLLGKYDAKSLQKKRALIVRLLGDARSEIIENVAETKEDRAELREDRREAREDRRQR